MRLWHECLIEKLPRQQLLGQHRECAALRGSGWGKKHATVNYVFNHSPYKLFQYHQLIMNEMTKRGYKPDKLWLNPLYRGKNTQAYKSLEAVALTKPIYPEHNAIYLNECLKNLEEKAIIL
ncbi:TIGR02328 family protein [Streptococcus marimammalium]|uniref:TIGR02328 family protein n=1 Tax=Streptococcus marimammalium TaxID=269666 RepID=UPI000377E4B2|nr:TIGR02328 family protein [Streptococcus marimammalium]